MTHKTALLLAGGSGLRAGSDLPKQFHDVCGRPLLWWSLRAFHEYHPETNCVVVMHPDYVSFWKELMEKLPYGEQFPFSIATGGSHRGESVLKGLLHIGDTDLVAVHDGARPLVTPRIIKEGFNCAAANGTAVPVCSVTDSLRRISNREHSNGSHSLADLKSKPADRSEYVSVQTPQFFDFRLLLEAYRLAAGKQFTDDASLVEAVTGREVTLFPGSVSNLKVTHPDDFAIAELLLKRQYPYLTES